MAMGMHTKFLVALMLLINALVVINIRRGTPEPSRDVVCDCADYRGGGGGGGGRDRSNQDPAQARVADDQDRTGKNSWAPAPPEGTGAGGGLRASSKSPEIDPKEAAAAGPGVEVDMKAPPHKSGDEGDDELGIGGGATIPAPGAGGAGGEGGDRGVSVSPEEQRMKETEECKSMMKTLKIVPNVSWGKATKPQQQRWDLLGCNGAIARVESAKKSGDQARGGLGLPDCTTRPSAASDPLIAVCAGSTTRGVPYPDEYSLALFRFLLPSLARTADCGFRYVAVIGYDTGDSFFDRPAGKAKTLSWFESEIAIPAASRGLSIELELVKVENSIKKPGPVFTAVTKAAYDRGANYFYRVNDDSEMHTPWARHFVDALEEMGPPYGVVGPESLNNNILVHDFTHRLHMDIFDMQYYPASLTDWYVDDWISRVYGNSRTIRAKNCRVEHHTGAHGQRYKEDKTKAGSVNGLVAVGARKISAWADGHGAEAAARQILSDKLDGKSATKARARDIP